MKEQFSLLSLIGNTPLIEIKRLNPNPRVVVYAKLEGQNPGGSVKDRAAYYMIQKALEQKLISKSTKLIEPTSGNTGIALAMIAQKIGIQIQLVMPENSSLERIKAMESFGAEVTLTPATKQMEGAIDRVRHLIKAKPGYYYMLNQFDNPHNVLAHYENTGPEIWQSTRKKITHFVSSMGTTGTIMGVSKYLKKKKPTIQIIGAQPDQGSNIPGIRRWPKEYLPKIYQEQYVDQKVDVSEQQAISMMKKLALEEGISSGPSSGGAAYIALKQAEQLEHGVIVFIVCDRGDRYFSMNY